MSKIYEALLRAELERAALQESNPAIASSIASQAGYSDAAVQAILSTLHQETMLLQEPVVPPEALAHPEPVAQTAVSFAPVQEVAQVAAGPEIDLDRVPMRAWTPSLKQLPSLEERGSEVEQFRSLRSRMHEFRDLNALKTVAVSSALPQEGKSFVAANLAVSFARHKAGRVLLIDGDMRRSSLHTMLGCPSEPGLTEYLSGKCTLVEVMQRARPREDGVPLPRGLASLTFIAGGADAKNAGDLSGSPRFGELIRLLSPLFDWIVVDTPPVNLVTDGVNLARSCDGALLIARGDVTKYEAVQRALAELKTSNMLGVVLNAVMKPPVTGGYYGYDGYDSNQG